jgi:hypothetical protein
MLNEENSTTPHIVTENTVPSANPIDVEFHRIADEYKKTDGDLIIARKEAFADPKGENLEKLHRLEIQLLVLKKMKEEILDKKIADALAKDNSTKKGLWS